MRDIKKQILEAIKKDSLEKDKFNTRESAKLYSLLTKSTAWYKDKEIYILGKLAITFTST